MDLQASVGDCFRPAQRPEHLPVEICTSYACTVGPHTLHECFFDQFQVSSTSPSMFVPTTRVLWTRKHRPLRADNQGRLRDNLPAPRPEHLFVDVRTSYACGVDPHTLHENILVQLQGSSTSPSRFVPPNRVLWTLSTPQRIFLTIAKARTPIFRRPYLQGASSGTLLFSVGAFSTISSV